MKEIAEIIDIHCHLCGHNVHCSKCEHEVPELIADIYKGWRSGEECKDCRFILDMTEKDELTILKQKMENLLDPEAQISETCPDCGGSGQEQCCNCHLNENGLGGDACKGMGIKCKPCPTCTDGKVWAWVKCDICEGEGEVPVDSGATQPWGDAIIIPQKCPVESCQDGLIPLTNKLALERKGQKYEIIKSGVKG
jgi:hypothetical protein